MRLFHYSDDPTIKVFEPRPVQVPVGRPKGFEWLNGALVCAIDKAREPMYHFRASAASSAGLLRILQPRITTDGSEDAPVG